MTHHSLDSRRRREIEELFEGALDLATSQELVQEASVAVIYVLHQALIRSGFAEVHAIELVQATAERALRGGR